MLLFFDTETVGLPKKWKAPVSDLKNWPRMVQLAFIFQDEKGNTIAKNDHIIKPVGFTIPQEVVRIHGISTEKALAEGVDLKEVLDEFHSFVNQAKYLVGHNIDFDEKIVGAEFLRNQMTNLLPEKRSICTMKEGADFCEIEGPYGYKWPKLSQLHQKLFGTDFENAHNAAADIEATANCFWALREAGFV